MTVTDIEMAIGVSGLLREFNEAGVLEIADVHVAQRVTALADESDETVALAVALAVRALRGGSVCVDLTTVVADSPDLPWPEPSSWLAAVHASGLVRTVLRLYDDRLLYLDRYWREEEQVCADLLGLLVSGAMVESPAVARLFRSATRSSGLPRKSRCRSRLRC